MNSSLERSEKPEARQGHHYRPLSVYEIAPPPEGAPVNPSQGRETD